MPVLLEPEYRRVKCKECYADIGFNTEEIQHFQWADRLGTFKGERVKCPRPGCRGYGYVRYYGLTRQPGR